MSRVRDVGQSQRTLFNFDIEDPFKAGSIDIFKDQFRRLNGRHPSAVEISTYYRGHPQELERRTGDLKQH